MIPNWWWTFIAHTIIIVVHWIIKKPFHFLIILIVFWFFSTQILLLAKTSVIDNNLSYLEDSNKCFNIKAINPDKKYIILRLDDIQASYLSDLSMKMINDWIKRKIPFTLGIIPINLDTDNTLVKYIKDNQCNLEIALRWFNNRIKTPEFQDISEKEALSKINAWLTELKKVTYKKIITFIPPDNLYSSGTISALKSKQFKIISWNSDAYYDYTSSAYVLDQKKLNDVNSIIKKSTDEANDKWFSVIMIHPQDYIDDIWNVDLDKYNQYIKLLDSLKKQWFYFTTMQDYYNHLKRVWIKTDFFDSTIKTSVFNKENQSILDDIN